MNKAELKSEMSYHTGEFLAMLLVIQPPLDVLSYFMAGLGLTSVTTAIRMALLVTVSLYGFLLSRRKQLYVLLYGVIAGFWLLHVLNCIRVGYQDPIGDAAEYLKLIQFPLWTASFLTLLQQRDRLDIDVFAVLAVNFVIILLVIGVSYLTGHPVYTYDYPEREIQIGVLGWFGVANAQSAILCLLAPALFLVGLNGEKMWIFVLCVGAGAGLLYLTGTRLTYYAALLIVLAFAALILFCRRPGMFCLPLAAALVLLIVLKGASPMAQRQKSVSETQALYKEKIQQIMGEEKDFTYRPGEEIPAPVMEKLKTVYRDVYGVKGIRNELLLEDLIGEFGLEKVMEKYEYTLDTEVLAAGRTRKLIAMDLRWESQDMLTRLLGMEYASCVVGDHIYDPENDSPAVLYYNGYLGALLYAGFVLCILAYGILAFLRRFPSLVTAEFGTAAMMFFLGLGAAQLSGQVLRKPNVTVYLSLAAAELILQAGRAVPGDRLRPHYKRNPAISLKKI